MALHILFARQRSGTGALGSVLDQHPSIDYLGEKFHPHEATREEGYLNFLLERIKADPHRGLPGAAELNYREYMAFLEGRGRKPHRILDVKYSSTHHFNGEWHSPCDMPRFVAWCKSDGRRIIHLKRRNLLKTYVSGLLAEANKVWHARPGEVMSVGSLEVDPDRLLRNLRSTARTVNHFDGYLRNHARVLEVEYEELFGAQGVDMDQLRRIADFLEVDPAPLSSLRPAFVKQTADDLDHVIVNFDAVVARLRGTDFLWMTGAT